MVAGCFRLAGWIANRPFPWLTALPILRNGIAPRPWDPEGREPANGEQFMMAAAAGLTTNPIEVPPGRTATRFPLFRLHGQ